MGLVYEGEDIRLGRKVAVKVMREDGQDGTMGERLFREAKAAARAEHPAVVTTYGYGTDPELGISYVVMERLRGETLAQRIARSGPLPISFVRRVALETADALAAVHEAGVVHRDLKPSNIFLASRGLRVDDVKLLDFGVAKQLDLQTLTATGEVYGTPVYMAPEQLSDSKHVKPRCDLYSFGVVLFECLAGVPPFSAQSVPALISEILFGPEPILRKLRADVSEDLAAVVARCMRRRADERFFDARAICKVLEASADSG
jgi:serine/threonine-protein kinase